MQGGFRGDETKVVLGKALVYIYTPVYLKRFETWDNENQQAVTETEDRCCGGGR